MEEENAGEDDYVDQEEPEEMEMEAKEFEEEAAPQEQAETMEPMEDAEVDTERPTSTTAEAVPQEPASPVELAEQFDSMITTKRGHNRQKWVNWSILRLRLPHKNLLSPWSRWRRITRMKKRS
jgi:hypothetical protein